MSESVELNRAFELVAELVEFISFVASFCMVSYTEFELLYLEVRDALSADLLLDKAVVLGAGKEAICRVLTEVTDEDLRLAVFELLTPPFFELPEPFCFLFLV